MDIVVKVDADIVRMATKKKVTISWSGGKDSAFALYKILSSGEFDVVNLHTVINDETKRVGLHGVREELIDLQAESIGLPLIKMYLEGSESHSAYEKLMKSFYRRSAAQRIHGVVFGDIFLEDLKKFREELLDHSKLLPLFPLWGLNTKVVVEDFIHLGFKTIICSANASILNAQQVGKSLTEEFLQNLPLQADPCGENGEFHTFVYDGPLFKKPVPFQIGDLVQKTYSFQKKNGNGLTEECKTDFWFQDLRPPMTP